MNSGWRRRAARIGALAAMLCGLLGLVLLRLILLVSVDGAELVKLARVEHTSALKLAAVRGAIVDRSGRPLALSAQAQSVYARSAALLGRTTSAERARLARALGASPARVEALLRRGAPFVWLGRQLEPAKAAQVGKLGLAGVGLVTEYRRFYPEGALAGSVVGLAGLDGQGLSGVELRYDATVRGAPVKLRLYHDALGHQMLYAPVASDQAVVGARLELTLDLSLQALAERELRDEVAASGARAASAVVLDPFSGELLVLANVSAQADPQDGRLHDGATQDAFEPGSTIKGILAAIALADGVVRPQTRIFCEQGKFRVDKAVIHDEGRHGWLELGDILEVSSNIGAAKIALALGARRYYDGLVAFGFGHKSGIDLPGEASGLLGGLRQWRRVGLATRGFGQGLAVTPLQLAVAYAAVANGGAIVRPYVVKAAYDSAGSAIFRQTPQVLRRAISPAVAHTVNTLLRRTVAGQHGTAHLAQVADFTVAGKTGTAQMVDFRARRYLKGRSVASFVGFLPAEAPRLVVLVVLYDVGPGHFGGLVAAPVFREIAAAALRGLNVAAPGPRFVEASLLGAVSEGAGQQASSAAGIEAADLSARSLAPAAADGRAPDFAGLSLRRALVLARRLGVTVSASGHGYVVRQEPLPGTSLSGHSLALFLAPDGRDGRPASRPSKTVGRANRARRRASG